MMNEEQRARAIIERLPSPDAINIIGQLRQAGDDWDDVESRLDSLADDISEVPVPFANEAERYVKRLLIAAFAAECAGMNN